jgi:hypothetical protein
MANLSENKIIPLHPDTPAHGYDDIHEKTGPGAAI